MQIGSPTCSVCECFFSPGWIPSAVLLLRDRSGWEKPRALFFKLICKTGCASAPSRGSAFLRTGCYNPLDGESERPFIFSRNRAFPGPPMSSSRVLGAASDGSDAMFGKELQSTHDSTKYSDLHSYLLGSRTYQHQQVLRAGESAGLSLSLEN